MDSMNATAVTTTSTPTTQHDNASYGVSSESFDAPVEGKAAAAADGPLKEPRSVPNADRAAAAGERGKHLFFIAGLVIVGVSIGVSLGVTMGMKIGSSNGNNDGAIKMAAPDDSPGDFTVGEMPDDEPDPPAIRKSTINQVASYLTQQDVSSLQVLETDGTPQNRAMIWMAEQDGADWAVPSAAITSMKGYQFATRYILAVFYYSTGGLNWEDQCTFLTATEVCDWHDVDVKGVRQGVSCDNESGQVFALVFDSNNLDGTFPSELGALTSLEVIAMNKNSIRGELPVELCRLLYLETLELSYNALEGIPTCIGVLTALELLFLSNNMMTGSLPQGIRTLTSLEGIMVDRNLLTGMVTNLFDDLVNLKWLHLEANDFSGTITDDFLANQSKLLQVDLSSNSFEGSFPLHFFTAIPELLVLDLHDNLLSKFFPEPILQNNNLRVLAIQQNKMTGSLPTTISNLQALVHLDVSNNLFTGDLPAEIGAMSSHLQYFFASANSFTQGPIPLSFASLTNLQELGLKSTKRIGEVPSFLGSLTEMILLDLDDNCFLGPLPSELGNLVNLKFLLLNRNQLVGSIPDTFSGLTSLRMAYLDRNALRGSLATLCELPLFQESAVDANGMQLLTADCGGDTPEVTCECCETCCEDSVEECNAGNYEIASVNPTWENYSRLYAIFGDETMFFTLEVPPTGF